MNSIKEDLDERREETVRELEGWHLAREAAQRWNRNLLQYGAGVAAVLGLAAGSGGVFAIASSLVGLQDTSASLPGWAVGVLGGVTVVASAVFVILMSLLIASYFQRRKAEGAADSHLTKLIGLAPERFIPRAE